MKPAIRKPGRPRFHPDRLVAQMPHVSSAYTEAELAGLDALARLLGIERKVSRSDIQRMVVVLELKRRGLVQ